jgi:hypothetical protein
MILLEEDAGSTVPVISTLNKGIHRSSKKNAIGGLHSLTLAQLFTAEGIACGHRVFIAGSDGRISPSTFLGSLPLNVSQDSLDVQAALKSVQKQQDITSSDTPSDNQGSDSSGSGLINAWQYKKYIPTAGGPVLQATRDPTNSASTPPPAPSASTPQSISIPTKYCHSFDLERNIRTDVLTSSGAAVVSSVLDQTHVIIKVPPSLQSTSNSPSSLPSKQQCSIAEAVLVAQSRSSQLSEDDALLSAAHASALVDFLNFQNASLSAETAHSVYTSILDRFLNSALLNSSNNKETSSSTSIIHTTDESTKQIVLETTPNPELKRRPSITHISGEFSGASPPPLPQSSLSSSHHLRPISSSTSLSSSSEPSAPPLQALRANLTSLSHPPQSIPIISATTSTTSTSLSSSAPTVSRIVLLGLGGPLWPGFCGSDAISSALNSNSAGLPHEDTFKSYKSMFRFIANLRTSLEEQKRSTNGALTVVLVTMPTWCMPLSVAAHVRKMFDVVLKLHAFGDPAYSLATSRSDAKSLTSTLAASTAPEFKDYTGMLIVRRLPRGVVVSGANGSSPLIAATPISLPDSLIWAMRREKRRLVIERPHLPPAGEEESNSLKKSNKIPQQQAQVSFTFGDTDGDDNEAEVADTLNSSTALEPGMSCKTVSSSITSSSLDF